MRLADWLLSEFDAEMASTRRVLERVPFDEPEWRPHEKSAPIGYLAYHVATLPGWTISTLRQTELDIQPPPGKTMGDDAPRTREGLLELFDTEVAEARVALAEATDESFQVQWTLKFGDRTLLTESRWTVYRQMIINHSVHHRAQLGVYLRLRGVPVPGTYGPSADEPAGPPQAQQADA